MDLHHEFDVNAGIGLAWPAFLDMPRLAPLMPGAEVTEVIDERNVKGGAKVKVGPINLRFAGTATITDVDDDTHTALLMAKGSDAKGRGNADADVRFSLTELAADRTHVDVATKLNLTGSVAQYGRASGLIDEIAAQLIGEFVQNLEAELAKDVAAADTTSADTTDTASADTEAAPATSSTAEPLVADKPKAAEPKAAIPQTDKPQAAEAVSGLTLFFKALAATIGKSFKKLISRARASS